MPQSYTPATGGGFAASRPLGSSPAAVEEALGSSRRPIGLGIEGPDSGGGVRAAPPLLALIAVVRIKITSDHAKKLTDKGLPKSGASTASEDFDAGGKPFPKEFTWSLDLSTGNARSHPVSHAKGTKVTLEVEVQNEHTQSIRTKLVGNVLGADAPKGMRFESNVKSFTTGRSTLTLDSTEPLPDEIMSFEFRVRWSFHGGVTPAFGISKLPYALTTVSRNEILLTTGEPQVADDSDLTYGRMAHAVQKAAATGKTTAHGIVGELVKSRPFDGSRSPEPWSLAKNPTLGTDCISIAKYVHELMKLLGFEGTFAAVIIYVRPTGKIRWKSLLPADPKIVTGFPAPGQVRRLQLLDPITTSEFKLIEENFPKDPTAGLEWPRIYHPSEEDWYLRLIDHSDGRNNYEGCVKFTDKANVTKWYPAGTDLDGLDSPKKVIEEVFKSLSWVEGDTIRTAVSGAMKDIKE